MNTRKKQALVASLNIPLAIASPFIGWWIGVMYTEHHHIFGCEGLDVVGLWAFLFSLVGFFLTGIINGIIQPDFRKVDYISFLYSIAAATVIIIIIASTGFGDYNITTFMYLAVLVIFSWIGCRTALAIRKLVNKKKQIEPNQNME